MKTIQVNQGDDLLSAIFTVIEAGGGLIDLGPGVHELSGVVDLGACSLAIRGQGTGISRIGGTRVGFFMKQVGAGQPYSLELSSLSIVMTDGVHAYMRIPGGATSEHQNPALTIRDVQVYSDYNGIVICGVWNATLDNVFVSGRPPADSKWDDLRGTGIEFADMCVNAHLSNVRTNFFATGIGAWAGALNTEGLFCNNCSMVGVKRGVWLKGNPAGGPGPRISTFKWVGGMIENRVKGVTTGSAAFHLENVWDAGIHGCTMLTESLDCPTTTYGVIAQDCRRVRVSDCDITAYHKGFFTTGACQDMVVTGNTFEAVATPVTFNPGCTGGVERDNAVR